MKKLSVNSILASILLIAMIFSATSFSMAEESAPDVLPENTIVETTVEEAPAARELAEVVARTNPTRSASIAVSYNGLSEVYAGDAVTLIAKLSGYEGLVYTIYWQYYTTEAVDGQEALTWVNDNGLTGSTRSLTLTRDNYDVLRRFKIVITGVEGLTEETTGSVRDFSEERPAVLGELTSRPATVSAEEAAAEEPATEELVIEEPAAEVPAIEEPAAEEPAVEEPVAEEPTVEEPVAEEPTVEEPVAEEPAVEEPAAKEPGAEEPAVEEPVAEEPVVEEPVVEEPFIEEPAAVEPAIEKPAVEEPAAEEPAAEEPAVQETALAIETAPVVRSVKIVTSLGGVINEGNTVTMTGIFSGFDDVQVLLQWQFNDGSGWQDITGANDFQYSYSATYQTVNYDWRLIVEIAD